MFLTTLKNHAGQVATVDVTGHRLLGWRVEITTPAGTGRTFPGALVAQVVPFNAQLAELEAAGWWVAS